MRKQHPADMRDAERIASAVRFSAYFRKSSSEAFHVACATLAEAREQAAILDKTHGGEGRRAGVYAIGADQGVTLVPSTYQPPGAGK